MCGGGSGGGGVGVAVCVCVCEWVWLGVAVCVCVGVCARVWLRVAVCDCDCVCVIVCVWFGVGGCKSAQDCIASTCSSSRSSCQPGRGGLQGLVQRRGGEAPTFMTGGTQVGTNPRSSPHTSMSVAAWGAGVARIGTEKSARGGGGGAR